MTVGLPLGNVGAVGIFQTSKKAGETMFNQLKSITRLILVLPCVVFGAMGFAAHPNRVVWEGEQGPGKGKHIVFVAGDHEYRGEESLPALARRGLKKSPF